MSTKSGQFHCNFAAHSHRYLRTEIIKIKRDLTELLQKKLDN